MTDIYDIKHVAYYFLISRSYIFFILVVVFFVVFYLLLKYAFNYEDPLLAEKKKKKLIQSLLSSQYLDLEQNIDLYDRDVFYNKLILYINNIMMMEYDELDDTINYKTYLEIKEIYRDSDYLDVYRDIYMTLYDKYILDDRDQREHFLKNLKV